jgi:long-chain acyl-CoA synthetase
MDLAKLPPSLRSIRRTWRNERSAPSVFRYQVLISKVIDINTGLNELPRGEDGEIVICGPQVMQGYWQRPEENEKVFREIDGKRYFLTGDIGHIDDEGYILITDRKKDMIIVGGFNVYPRDVEDILFTHPKVALAAVVGVPDDKSGETVKAYHPAQARKNSHRRKKF